MESLLYKAGLKSLLKSGQPCKCKQIIIISVIIEHSVITTGACSMTWCRSTPVVMTLWRAYYSTLTCHAARPVVMTLWRAYYSTLTCHAARPVVMTLWWAYHSTHTKVILTIQ